MRAGSRRHKDSGRSKARGFDYNDGGGQKMCQERVIRRGRRKESGRDEDGVAVIMAATMSSRRRWAVDDATSQTAGWQTM